MVAVTTGIVSVPVGFFAAAVAMLILQLLTVKEAYDAVEWPILILFGALMSTQTADVGENEPTPWLGIQERIAVEGAILWQSVFAAMLLLETSRRNSQATQWANGGTIDA